MSHRHGDEVTDADVRLHDANMRLLQKEARREIDRLRMALKKYTNCRHSCQDCSCTMEARAALYAPDEAKKEKYASLREALQAGRIVKMPESEISTTNRQAIGLRGLRIRTRDGYTYLWLKRPVVAGIALEATKEPR